LEEDREIGVPGRPRLLPVDLEKKLVEYIDDAALKQQHLTVEEV
jgi:hypothetical protein